MMKPDLVQIAQRAFNTPLLIAPAKAAVIAQHLGPRFLGQASDLPVQIDGWTGQISEEHRAPKAGTLLGDEVHQVARRRQAYSVVQGVAVIPIVGSLVRRGSYIGASSGVTSYEGISAQLRAAAEDDEVRVIALEIDSFGGEAAGIFDLGAQIRRVREIKPVRAFVADYALSAGYAIASQADHITVPPFGEAGSVGVVCMHADYEGYLEKEGIRITLVHSGARKVDGNPFEALPAGTRERLQAECDDMWRAFAAMVEEGRRGRVTAQQALDTEADVFRGQAAVGVGFADAVAEARTAFAALLAEVNPAITPVGGRSAAMAAQPVVAQADQPIVAGLAARDAIPADPAPAATKEEPMDWDSLTTAELREHRADIVSDIEASASAGADQRVQEALASERTRIAEIDAIAVAGHESLVAAAKADGRSAAELALEMVKADKAAGAGHLTQLRQADASAAVPAAPQTPVETTALSGTPEEQAADAWDKSAVLRAEFGNSKEAYLAFAKAEASGRARILRKAS